MGADSGPPAQRRPDDPAAALAERLFQDMTGALELFTVYLGDRLGLYRALHAGGPATSAAWTPPSAPPSSKAPDGTSPSSA